MYKEYLKEYKPANDLRGEDKEAIKRELRSSLKDGYRGQVCVRRDFDWKILWFSLVFVVSLFPCCLSLV